MSRNVVRVLPDEGNWKVTFNGKYYSSHVLKQTAIDKGRGLAKANTPSQLIIHKADGTIETEYTYERDPYPPRG